MSGAFPKPAIDRHLFGFATRRLRWCAGIPMAPQLLDATLILLVSLVDRPRLKAMETLERHLLEIPDVTIGIHALGGVGFRLKGFEFAHLHGTGLFDVILRGPDAEEARCRGDAQPHHRFPESNWVSYWIDEEVDIPGALHLARLAIQCLTSGGTLEKSGGV